MGDIYEPEIYDEAEFKRDAPAEVVRQVDLRCPKEYLFCQYLVMKNTDLFAVTYEHPTEEGLSFDMEGYLSSPPESWEASMEMD